MLYLYYSDLSFDLNILIYKYISRKNRIEGYYSGYTFANQLGLTAQLPYTLEIVSNEASSKCREVNVKEQRIILRRPRTEVNRDNCVLQLLDLLKDLDQYTDEDIDFASEKISFYIKKNNIKREDVDKDISLFPTKVYKSIYEARLYNVFA